MVALLGPGNFFVMAGVPFSDGDGTAEYGDCVLVIEKKEMVPRLNEEHKLSDRFIAYLLTRNVQE